MRNLLRSLFGNEEQAKVQSTERPDGSAEPFGDAGPVLAKASKVEPPQLIVGCARSVGMQRDHNEDSLFTLTANIAVDSLTLPFGIYIVADGMGGHQYGEFASETAVRSVSGYLMEHLYGDIFGMEQAGSPPPLTELLRDAVLQGNSVVSEKAPGGGTTLTCVVVMGSRMTIAHVGDSRAYAVYLDGRMQLLTRDHSLVKRLEELGQITSGEAENHPQKNVLYRALGQAEPFEPDVSTAPIPQPGYVLVCSDGLWGLISDEDMFRLIQGAPNPQVACQALVDAANAAGGHDNITAILIRMAE